MEKIPIELAKESIKQAADIAKSFLSKLVGPASEEAGLILKENVRFYRLKNQLRILRKAQDMLNEAGIEPNAVPLRTLLPLLEGASLEDDESLGDKWAALLANAAAGAITEGSHPSFPKILGEMSPQEALMLDRLCTQGGETPWDTYRQDMAKELSLSIDDINRKYWNLFRLGLCKIGIKPPAEASMVSLSPFGHFFTRVCSSPAKNNT